MSEQQNNKQKLQILEALHVRIKQPKLDRTYLNVFSYCCLLIETNKMLKHPTRINNKHL